MARPNVTFTVVDESLVVPIGEASSTTIGGCYNPSNALKALAGTTAERDQGYIFVPNQSDWYTRLTNLVISNAGGVAAAASINVGYCAATYVNGVYPGTGTGISAEFKDEWWPINNFLQYGAGCYVGWGTSTVTDTFLGLGYDVVFQGGTAGVSGSNYASAVTQIITNRSSGAEPVFGILNVGSTTGTISEVNVADLVGYNAATSADENIAAVYGEKVHLDLTGSTYITTPLAADIAGCIARTDREAYPWFSPAGPRRGRILNVVRLNDNLKEVEQDILYDDGINPVVTFRGDGTILFGDKTSGSETSTLSRINVVRLFHYIKKALAPVARSILFEQNDSLTRSRFKIAAEGFLDRIVGQRGISEYRVICDSTNNTPEIVEANYFVADILVKPITSINYVKITLTNKDLSDTI